MKILSIGNSFSQDAHRWLHDLAAADGVTLDTVNLVIGGCSLETHWNNVLADAHAYAQEGNSGQYMKETSIREALEADRYDAVTLQQASGLSGIPSSYHPYVEHLAATVRQLQPETRLLFHRTWSYEIDSDHPAFPQYGRDQEQMFRRLRDASAEAAASIGVEVIPVGDAIQTLRMTVAAFDYRNGGLSLCRDGFHLSLDYGRFAAAAVWYTTLTGRPVAVDAFAAGHPDFDAALLHTIVNALA